MRKTYVMFTIDAEAKLYTENGFWSYHVNGLMPRDLPRMIKENIVEPGLHGYQLLRENLGPRLREMRGAEFDTFDPAKFDPADIMARAKGGLPSIFRSLDKYGFKSTAFVDFSGLYTFGAQEFGETMALMDHLGHDPQVHFHVMDYVYTDPFFDGIGAIRPDTFEIETWDAETLDRVFGRIRADYERLLKRPPIAYRAGAYRVSDNILRALHKYGFLFDFSYNHVEKHASKRHTDKALRFGNHPLALSNLLEIPVTAFRVDPGESKIDRFRVSDKRQNRRFKILKNLHEDMPPVITYILHSPTLMKTVTHSDKMRRGRNLVVRLDEDPELVKIFEDELDMIASQKNIEVITSAQLAERADELRQSASTGRYFFQDLLAQPRLGAAGQDDEKRVLLKGHVCSLCGAPGIGDAADDAADHPPTDICGTCGSTAEDRTFKIFFDAVLKPDVFDAGMHGAALLVNPGPAEKRLMEAAFAHARLRIESGEDDAQAWRVASARGPAAAGSDFILLGQPPGRGIPRPSPLLAIHRRLPSGGLLCFHIAGEAGEAGKEKSRRRERARNPVREKTKIALRNADFHFDVFHIRDMLNNRMFSWWLCEKQAPAPVEAASAPDRAPTYQALL
jgi:hypothetical protein